MEVITGTKQINWNYDRTMSERIAQYSMHGIDVKNHKHMKQPNIFAEWIRENEKKDFTPKRIILTEEQAKKTHDTFQNEIDRVMIRRKFKEMTNG